MSYLYTAWFWLRGHPLEFIYIITLYVLWRTMKASEHQSEGMLKPVLTLRRKGTTAPGEHETELTLTPIVPFQITNAGTGPALMVAWRFVAASGREVANARGKFPFIKADTYVNTQVVEERFHSGTGVFPVTLECNYESTSGVLYRSIDLLRARTSLHGWLDQVRPPVVAKQAKSTRSSTSGTNTIYGCQGGSTWHVVY